MTQLEKVTTGVKVVTRPARTNRKLAALLSSADDLPSAIRHAGPPTASARSTGASARMVAEQAGKRAAAMKRV
jgi:hypothetical protein